MTVWYIGRGGRWISMTFCKNTDVSCTHAPPSRTKAHLFEIDLGVGTHTRLADEVDDPLLALVA